MTDRAYELPDNAETDRLLSVLLGLLKGVLVIRKGQVWRVSFIINDKKIEHLRLYKENK